MMKAFAHRVLILAAVLGFLAPVYAVDLAVTGAWKLLSFYWFLREQSEGRKQDA